MQYSATLDPVALIEAESNALPDSLLYAVSRPCPDSFDSAPEFSLQHFLEVYRLVEIENSEADRYVFDDACLGVA
jgi:hypothetical protein